jgi:hypothetical protein
MNAPLPALPLDEEAAHAAAGQPIQVILLAPQRETHYFDKPLSVLAQMAPQPEHPLAVLAEGVEPHGHRLAVRPE